MEYQGILLDLLERVKRLEDKVLKLETEKNDNEESNILYSVPNKNNDILSNYGMINTQRYGYGKKDKTKYLFNGKMYPKNRLVLAVVKKYMSEHPNTTMNQLKNIFSYEIIGNFSYGVVKPVEEAKKWINNYELRYFTEPDEIIHTADGEMYCCTQWTIDSIKRFIERTEQLGFEIEPIER